MVTTPKASTTGPKWLTFIGLFLFLASIAAAVGAVIMFLKVVPMGILNLKGEPSDSVVLLLEPGESDTVELEADKTYWFWLVGDKEDEPFESGTPSVTGPDGTSVWVAPSLISASASSNATAAEYAWEFETSTAGTYTVQASPNSNADLGLALGQHIGSTVGSVSLALVLVFVAIGTGLPGVGMLIAGPIWWRSRRRAGRYGDHGPGIQPWPAG